MTTQYTHRMTLAVPESLMAAANQLALIAGESLDDVNTFTTANWQDSDGNKYAVCSTVIKPIVLAMIGKPVADITLPAHAINADVAAAQQALDKVVMYKQGDQASTAKIMCAIDFEPLQAFSDMGLTIVESDLV